MKLMFLDEPLSEEGSNQVETVARLLAADDFLSKHEPELHIHSPLQRARDTHIGLFPDATKTQLECLREMTPLEYLFSKHALRRRIVEFETWLAERDESKVVVVGHSQYFRLMLGTQVLMDNCAVLHCTFHPDREEKWEIHQILYSPQMAEKSGDEIKTDGDR